MDPRNVTRGVLHLGLGRPDRPDHPPRCYSLPHLRRKDPHRAGKESVSLFEGRTTAAIRVTEPQTLATGGSGSSTRSSGKLDQLAAVERHFDLGRALLHDLDDRTARHVLLELPHHLRVHLELPGNVTGQCHIEPNSDVKHLVVEPAVPAKLSDRRRQSGDPDGEGRAGDHAHADCARVAITDGRCRVESDAQLTSSPDERQAVRQTDDSGAKDRCAAPGERVSR